ncbi:MAG: tripartite tricarboxylate transporter TctB family protein [Casimicrobiaceae bacterium]
MSIRAPKDFWAGMLFIAIGGAAVGIAINYPMGSAARMGPGYFPRALGSLLILLGAFSVWRGLRAPGAGIMRWQFRPIVVVLGSTVVFGHIVQYAGLVLSTIFLVVASSAGSHEFRPREAAVVGVLIAALCAGVFVYGLNIQLPVWPTLS